MYKGKFDAKTKGNVAVAPLPRREKPAEQKLPTPKKLTAEQELPAEQLIPTQEQAPAEAPVAIPQEAAQETPKEAPVEVPQENPAEAPKEAAPADSQEPLGAKTEEPAKIAKKEKKEKKTKKAKRGPTAGTVVFYTLYFLMVLGICGAFYYVYGVAENFLADYQASDPTSKSEEVFQEFFADPDWAELYVLAGIQDTAYEGTDAFVAYMENKVGNTELIYMETSNGLSPDKKYNLKLGDENIGFFLMKGENTDFSLLKGENIGKYLRKQTADVFPHWELAGVELFYSRLEDVTIDKMAGHTVYVNGVALDDSFTVRSTYTVAEEYLPDDVSGLRTETQYISGFLVEPQITVLDENGQPVDVVYDAEKDVYSAIPQDTPSNTISAEEENVVIKAGETYALYMIEKAFADDLLKYYDKNSNVYQAITKMRMWMQNCNGYDFANESVTNYYRYSDTLFSAKVHMDLNVTRTNNTVKTYTVDTTLFFEYQKGSWKCIEMTNVDVLQQVHEVRITFMNEDVLLSSKLYATNIRQLTAPVISAPEGKVFDGWYRETLDANGNKTYDLVFPADPSGIIAIPDGYDLEPLVLYALFTDVEAETTGGTEAAQ